MFVCAGCGAELTAPVSRVALPVHTRYGAREKLHPPLMEAATYAVDPEPSGAPWRLPDGAGETAAAGGPVHPVPFAARDRIVIAPGDSRGLALIPEKCAGYCCGVDGREGPNLACEGCGRAVATRIDDCGSWQAVWLEPDAVHRLPSGLPAAAPPDWDDLARDPRRVPPLEEDGWWSPRWEAAVGVALAHLVVACERRPVVLPAGPVAELLSGAVASVLPAAVPAGAPAGLPARTLGLAGPGIPVPRTAPDILLVPRHPLTGEPWRPPSGAPAVVPLDTGVWAYLAHPAETSPIPATGTLPAGVLRDDYPVRHRPKWRLEIHRRAFADTLARLTAVRPHPAAAARSAQPAPPGSAGSGAGAAVGASK
ncbi:hypothetical protein [Streptomyces sp. NRRL F-2747]|uniref:hypothetical protein n=1 Tax=Streptomyces sp. NRRL F-2747 TaxID=1463843 RepID=UPI001F3557A6|nr:hypothetical protein [Streptomyces sp. NRRL F-2747]